MKKLNNKAFTLVELIITFVILMVLIFSMMSTILALKNNALDVDLQKDLREYKNNLTKVIYDDLIYKKYVKSNKNLCVSNENNIECTLKFQDDVTKTLVVNKTNYVIVYDGNNYPIPFKEYLTFDNSSFRETCNISNDIEINEQNKFLNIRISYFEIDKCYDYGINIKYPIY